jgi:hypothetical protein
MTTKTELARKIAIVNYLLDEIPGAKKVHVHYGPGECFIANEDGIMLSKGLTKEGAEIWLAGFVNALKVMQKGNTAL